MVVEYVELYIGNSFVTRDDDVVFIGNGSAGHQIKQKSHVIINITEGYVESLVNLLNTIKIVRESTAVFIGVMKAPHCQIFIGNADDAEGIISEKIEELCCVKAIRDEVRIEVGDIDLHDLVQVISCPGLECSDLKRKYLDLV